jgi:hypothetical protein
VVARLLVGHAHILDVEPLDVKTFDVYSLDIEIFEIERRAMRISDPQFTKLLTDARIEQLRGRRLPRRPRSARSN